MKKEFIMNTSDQGAAWKNKELNVGRFFTKKEKGPGDVARFFCVI